MKDESPIDYHKRLVYGKLVDKTLSDYDYSEIAEALYGRSYSSDVARRMIYGSRKTLEILDDFIVSNITDKNVLNEIEIQKAELRKESQKFYDQRREYNKVLSIEGRMEHLCELLSKSASSLSESLGYVLHDEPTHTIAGGDRNYNEAILVFSDWHYGMTTSNVFNEYNTSICIERVNRVVNSAIKKILLHGCVKLHIVILGDLCHGAIHSSARVASEELVCDQIMHASEILAQCVEKLSRYVEETTVYMTYGNHMRTVQNKKDSIHRDNMERIIPWWLMQRLRGYDNISIADPSDNEFLFINACGHEICASHGDLDSVKFAPRLLTTVFQKKYGKDIEYILLGDKHHRESFNELGVTASICGSLCGTDDYANDKRLYSKPEQMMLIVTPEDGVDAEYHIKCD